MDLSKNCVGWCFRISNQRLVLVFKELPRLQYDRQLSATLLVVSRVLLQHSVMCRLQPHYQLSNTNMGLRLLGKPCSYTKEATYFAEERYQYACFKWTQCVSCFLSIFKQTFVYRSIRKRKNQFQHMQKLHGRLKFWLLQLEIHRKRPWAKWWTLRWKYSDIWKVC